MLMMRVGRCRAIIFLGGCLKHIDGFNGGGSEYVFDTDVHGDSWLGSGTHILSPERCRPKRSALCAPLASRSFLPGRPGWVFGIEGSSCKSTPHPAYGSELSTGGGRLVRA